MLKFSIFQSDLKSKWKIEKNGFTAGDSWIKPYSHSFVETFYLIESNRFFLIIRESVFIDERGDSINPKKINPSLFSKKIGETKNWPLDWLILEIHQGVLSINVGSKGVAPVYLIEQIDSIKASWDPYDLYSFLPNQPLNLERSIHYISNFSQPYSSNTVFKKMVRLTERSKAKWNPKNNISKLQIKYPEPQQLPKPRLLKKGANPAIALQKIISNYLKNRIPDDQEIHSHLSGGFDSGLTTSLASLLFLKPVNSYSLIQQGIEGVEQLKRCKEFIKNFDLSEKSYKIENTPVFKESYSRISIGRVVPWEDCYSEAFEQILIDIKCNNGSILLMGTGGDELLYPHWEELNRLNIEEQKKTIFPSKKHLPSFLTDSSVQNFYNSFLKIDRAPNSILSPSALDDKAINAPQCLRYNIWPIHPLANIDVVNFCRSLPKEWRNDRFIFKNILKTLGCSSNITSPKNKESFSRIMKKSLTNLSKSVIEELFINSKLAEMGIINKTVLLNNYRQFCKGNSNFKSSFFYSTAILEMTLISINKQKVKKKKFRELFEN